MYVCLCNGIKESELRDLAGRGVRTAEDAYRRLGVDVNCADCAEYVQIFIDEALGAPARERKASA